MVSLGMPKRYVEHIVLTRREALGNLLSLSGVLHDKGVQVL